MKLYDAKGNSYVASKVNGPKIYKEGRGRTWDTVERKLDGERIEMFLDTSYGTSLYFEIAGQWYRLPFFKSPMTASSETDAYEVEEFWLVRKAVE